VPAGVKPNHAYFPLLITEAGFGLSRDQCHDALKLFNLNTRKYFHPLCSSYPCYSGLPSADPALLPVAERAARQVLCLPIYGTLPARSVRTICMIIRALAGLSPR